MDCGIQGVVQIPTQPHKSYPLITKRFIIYIFFIVKTKSRTAIQYNGLLYSNTVCHDFFVLMIVYNTEEDQ